MYPLKDNAFRLEPSEIPEIVAFARFALLIPADPDRFEFVSPVIVFQTLLLLEV